MWRPQLDIQGPHYYRHSHLARRSPSNSPAPACPIPPPASGRLSPGSSTNSIVNSGLLLLPSSWSSSSRGPPSVGPSDRGGVRSVLAPGSLPPGRWFPRLAATCGVARTGTLTCRLGLRGEGRFPSRPPPAAFSAPVPRASALLQASSPSTEGVAVAVAVAGSSEGESRAPPKRPHVRASVASSADIYTVSRGM